MPTARTFIFFAGAYIMRCLACQHDNSAAARFCEACGTRLVRTCPGCSREVSPTAKFCSECGQSLVDISPPGRLVSAVPYTPKHLAEKILTARSALEGERKQVTVLF